MRRRSFYCISLFLFFTSGLIPSSAVQAQGDLMVIPTRVVLEAQKRFEVLTVLNRGIDSAQYTISFLQYRMTEKGELQEITENEAAATKASEMIRYFPKQVYLAPGESQTVRIQVTKPEGLADGEYRSHLYFRSVPKEENMLVRSDSNDLSVNLKPVFGVSVPVIVRQGELTASVTLRDPKVTNETPGRLIVFNLDRVGNRSVYGDVTVELKKANGESRVVGALKGISVYTPNATREARIPLSLTDDDKGTLLITYKHKADGRETLLAESQMILQ